MRKLKAVILGIFIFFEAFSLMACLLGLWSYGGDADRVTIGNTVENALAALLMLAISIGGLLRMKKKEKFSLIQNILSLVIAYLCVLAIGEPFISGWNADSIEVVVVLLVLAAFVLVMTFGLPALIKICVNKEDSARIDSRNEEMVFVWYDSYEEYGEAVEAEYREALALGIFNETPSDEDSFYDKVAYYCQVNFSYFIVWLVRHDFLRKQRGYNRYGQKEFDAYVDYLHHDEGDPVTTFMYLYDPLGSDDVDSRVHEFLCEYLEYHSFNRFGSYDDDLDYARDDYFKDNSNHYCHDFSWDIYRSLEVMIDEAFKKFGMAREGLRFMDETSEMQKTVFCCDWLGCNMNAQMSGDDVSEEYRNLCIDHFNNMSEGMKTEILSKLVEHGYSEEEALWEHCHFDTINVFRPYGTEAAYTIGGEADFEKEHGIAIAICGNQVLYVGYRCDVEYTSPWSYE